MCIYRVGQKTGPFLNVDNFAMVSGRKVRDMSKVCKFCLEKKYKKPRVKMIVVVSLCVE